jgi:hypothetical protein
MNCSPPEITVPTEKIKGEIFVLSACSVVKQQGAHPIIHSKWKRSVSITPCVTDRLTTNSPAPVVHRTAVETSQAKTGSLRTCERDVPDNYMPYLQRRIAMLDVVEAGTLNLEVHLGV